MNIHVSKRGNRTEVDLHIEFPYDDPDHALKCLDLAMDEARTTLLAIQQTTKENS